MSYILVTGDRNWRDFELIKNALANQLQAGDIVLQGGNGYFRARGYIKEWAAKNEDELMRCIRGADALAAQAAIALGYPIETHFAAWSMYGRSAGPRRNEEMRKVPGIRLVLAFHDNLRESKGTRDMCMRMLKDDIKVLLCDHDDPYGLPLAKELSA